MSKYPAFLEEITPGAREAREAFEAAVTEADPAAIQAEVKASIAAAYALGRHVDGEFVPKQDVTFAEFEAAQHRKLAALKAQEQASRRIGRLRARYDEIMKGSPADPAARRAAAAKVALAKHDQAVAAWETLRAALDDRDEAWKYAGSPGRDWSRTGTVPAGGRRFVVDTAANIIDGAISGLDVEGLRRVADGEEIAHDSTDLAAIPSKDERKAAKSNLFRK